MRDDLARCSEMIFSPGGMRAMRIVVLAKAGNVDRKYHVMAGGGKNIGLYIVLGLSFFEGAISAVCIHEWLLLEGLSEVYRIV